MFWALKASTAFSARRRTTQLFLADPTPAGSPAAYAWVDNTDGVWRELRAVLDRQPAALRVAVDAHRELAFASGLHAGERDAAAAALGPRWAARLVPVHPMLPVELVARMVPGRLPWYRRLMETAWAVVEEAFSENVIVPGVTRSSVCVVSLISPLSSVAPFYPPPPPPPGGFGWKKRGSRGGGGGAW